MGNNYDVKERKFYMHLKFIGLNIQTFYNNFKNSPSLHEIIKLWEIDSLEDTDLLEQINEYFDFLQNKNNDEDNNDLCLRECLVVKMKNIFDPLINFIYEKMNDLSLKQFLPLVLILTSENLDKELPIDTNKYDQIDPRFFFIENYTEDPEKIEETIVPIILRFCSIHNELGDEFSLDKNGKEEKLDLIERVFPFNLNMACIGRFGQGKSTGVNQILQEYKAKESNNGCSQTKRLTLYQVKNKPIRILDIPGFENEKTVNDAIEKLKECRGKLNRLKDNMHIILYFLDYKETRAFMDLEYPILEEISNLESAKIIYVMTRSKSKNPKTKKKIFDRINSRFLGIAWEKPLFDKKEMFEATENNVVFVNFHYDEDLDLEPFGKEELFKKIYDFFVNSKDYKESLKKYSNEEEIEKTALKLRAEAERILLPDKIYGALSGLYPLGGWAIQNFYIKKNALIKIGQIFGIEVKYIDKDNEKEKELFKKKEKNENDIYYITPTPKDNGNNSYVIGNNWTKKSAEHKIPKSFKCSPQATLASQSSEFGDKTTLVELAATQATSYAASFSILGGCMFMGLGVVLGVGCGVYFTHKFCEENLDKFVEYYKKNSNKIKNSYEEAANYFLNW